MAEFVKGDVVVVPFPFSDLTQAKRRPALVLAELDGDDRILRQITSKAVQDRYAIALREKDFAEGGLNPWTRDWRLMAGAWDRMEIGHSTSTR